jgi:hypothetical protein
MIYLQFFRTKARRGSIWMGQTKEMINSTIVDQEGSLAPRNQRKRKNKGLDIYSYGQGNVPGGNVTVSGGRTN